MKEGFLQKNPPSLLKCEPIAHIFVRPLPGEIFSRNKKLLIKVMLKISLSLSINGKSPFVGNWNKLKY
jgi:hypothetical protein